MSKILALLALLWISPAAAQNTQCSTRAAGDSSNACASTAFVGTAISTQATLSANSVFGNATAGSAAGTSLAIPSCSTTASALLYTTNSGFSCNTTINAGTLNGATFASPGAIGGTSAGTGKFTSLTLTSLAFSNTAPTISSGFCSSGPSVVANNGTAAFTVNVGTSCATSTGTVGMPTAANGWVCTVNNITNVARFDRQTGGTASTVVVTNTASSALQTATNFTASDILAFACTAY